MNAVKNVSEVFCNKRCFKKFRKIYRNTCIGSFFYSPTPQALLKQESSAVVSISGNFTKFYTIIIL